MKRHHFTYESRFGLVEAPELKKKQLADLSCDIGSVCEFDCTYCHAIEAATRLKPVQEILEKGYALEDFSLYRTKGNVLSCLERDLMKIEPADRRTVFFCTSCDPCGTPEHVDITTGAIRLIMERSDLQVRVLSKSCLIMDVARALLPYKDRITYGISTGTEKPRISAAIEAGTSPISWRLQTLRRLQDEGFRTYGMLWPFVPFSYLDDLVKAIRPKKCEMIWAEPFNPGMESLSDTCKKLDSCGIGSIADEIRAQCKPDAFREFSEFCLRYLRNNLRRMNAVSKLRFIQHVNKKPAEFKHYFKVRRQ